MYSIYCCLNLVLLSWVLKYGLDGIFAPSFSRVSTFDRAPSHVILTILIPCSAVRVRHRVISCCYTLLSILSTKKQPIGYLGPPSNGTRRKTSASVAIFLMSTDGHSSLHMICVFYYLSVFCVSTYYLTQDCRVFHQFSRFWSHPLKIQVHSWLFQTTA